MSEGKKPRIDLQGAGPNQTPAQIQSNYEQQLYLLEINTRQRCANVWAALPQDPEKRRLFLQEAFEELGGVFGDAADELGSSYVILNRVANGQPIGQVEHSTRHSIQGIEGQVQDVLDTLDTKGDTAGSDMFQRRMVNTVLNRSRNVVKNSADKAGNRWCRVPEANACSWCLMLASRGAVYQSEATAKGSSKDRYHAHCRCHVKEVFDDGDLPKSTQACVDWYNKHGSLTRDHVTSGAFSRETGIYSSTLENANNKRLGTSKVPQHFVPSVMDNQILQEQWPYPSDEGIRIMLDGEPNSNGRRFKGGHLYGTGHPNKSEFPQQWLEEDLINAAVLTMANPQYTKMQGDRRVYRRDVHGIIVEAAWYMQPDGTPMFIHAYPICGDGVNFNNPDGTTTVIPYNLGYLDGTITT